jgi:N-acetylglucosamine-6-sulfatase
MLSGSRDPGGDPIESSVMEHSTRRNFLLRSAIAALAASGNGIAQPRNARRRNVIFIVSDDHRYDAFGFMRPQPWLRTPQLDTLAREGAHLKNAFVTSALCSPSRASILTGLYAHSHKIVDNNTAIPRGCALFPAVAPAGRLQDRVLRKMAHGQCR